MSSSARRLFTAFAFLLALGALAGCSKTDRTATEPGLTQTEADDLVQAVMAEAATDSGGWLVEVASTVQGTPIQTAPALGVSAIGAVSSRDTMFTTPSGNLTWTFNYTYYDVHGQPSDSPGDSTTSVEANTQAQGRLAITPFGGTTGTTGFYRHQSEFFSMEGLFSLDTALVIHNSSYSDSALCDMQSGGQHRYYLLDNTLTYDLLLPKRLLSSPPAAADAFKASGQVEVDAFVSVLPSFALGPSVKLLDTTMIITFDGSDTPLASITANTDPPTTVFKYRVNLKTGGITRAS